MQKKTITEVFHIPATVTFDDRNQNYHTDDSAS